MDVGSRSASRCPCTNRLPALQRPQRHAPGTRRAHFPTRRGSLLDRRTPVLLQAGTGYRQLLAQAGRQLLQLDLGLRKRIGQGHTFALHF